MNQKLIRRTSSSPIWLACWSDECKGEIIEHQPISTDTGKGTTTFRCTICHSIVTKTLRQIQELTNDIVEA